MIDSAKRELDLEKYQVAARIERAIISKLLLFLDHIYKSRLNVDDFLQSTFDVKVAYDQYERLRNIIYGMVKENEFYENYAKLSMVESSIRGNVFDESDHYESSFELPDRLEILLKDIDNIVSKIKPHYDNLLEYNKIILALIQPEFYETDYKINPFQDNSFTIFSKEDIQNIIVELQDYINHAKKLLEQNDEKKSLFSWKCDSNLTKLKMEAFQDVLDLMNIKNLKDFDKKLIEKINRLSSNKQLLKGGFFSSFFEDKLDNIRAIIFEASSKHRRNFFQQHF